MTATREHLAGLELALNRWNDGGPAIQYGKLLSELIAEAQSAPEPVEGEAVAYVYHGKPGEVYLGWSHLPAPPGFVRAAPLYTAAPEPVTREDAERFLADYHAEVWAAAEDEDSRVAYDDAGRSLAKAFLAKFDGRTAAMPDTELVTLLTELRLRVPLPDWARIRIDAKLSAYRA